MFHVVKKNKRLWLYEDDTPLYTPVDFLIVQSRDQLKEVANKLNNGANYIDTIIEFETSCKRKRRPRC